MNYTEEKILSGNYDHMKVNIIKFTQLLKKKRHLLS